MINAVKSGNFDLTKIPATVLDTFKDTYGNIDVEKLKEEALVLIKEADIDPTKVGGIAGITAADNSIAAKSLAARGNVSTRLVDYNQD